LQLRADRSTGTMPVLVRLEVDARTWATADHLPITAASERSRAPELWTNRHGDGTRRRLTGFGV
jgi:hypothetical protein